MALLYRVRTVFTGVAGSPYYSNLYFLQSAGTAQQAAGAVGTFFVTCADRMHNLVDFATEAEVATIDDTTGETVGSTSTTPGVGSGTDSSSPLPPATQGLVRWTTGTYVNGRQIRGRTFLPCPTTAEQQDGQPILGYRTAWDAAAEALIADANCTLVVYSPTNNVSANVTAASVWTEFAVLRSRRD